MSYWLATDRDGQHSDYIQRFDPRFWTVDFPRPMMASVVTTSPDSIRVELEFHHKNALAGLIWDSEDRFDHPLLAYETDRDYSRTVLRFRWRSSGIVPLDQVHGPTLTVEGRDDSGKPRSWYVRLWNYATGAPDDAIIDLRFSDLREGWDILANSIPVYSASIDRMFVSLTPPGYEAGNDALLSKRVEGWVEVSQIRCEGDRCLLEIGDILLPPHELRMATAYDDSYNLTPERILRNLRGLGYRKEIVHYVGMSHYFRLVADETERMLVDTSGSICQPCIAWHGNYMSNCVARGYDPIISLSYELFNEHCPEDWKQRFFDGSPALTGWDPPSTLLSPANDAAVQYLADVAEEFVRLAIQAECAVAFQIGEPWWWQAPDNRIALYDAAASDAFTDLLGFAPPEIPNLTLQLNAQQKDLLDKAGTVLGESGLVIRDRVKRIAGPDAQVLILLFTPTILGSKATEAYRANVPSKWAWPHFDRLQLEDYDWLTDGAEALRREGYRRMQSRLGYPFEKQDYLSGFVLRADDAAEYWKRIDQGIEEAAERGVQRSFVWALPQVARDGYTRLPNAGAIKNMQAFDDVLYPLSLGKDASVSPEFSTSVSITASGHERRNSHWTDARLRFDVGPGIRSEAELGTLIAFFRARRGAARGFRLTDPFDFSSNGMSGVPSPTDQLLGYGDGHSATFQLAKRYGVDDPQRRTITRPQIGTIRVSVSGVEIETFSLGSGGRLLLDEAPPEGAEVRAGFLFDVPVRFAEDRLDVTGAAFAAGEAPSVPLLEIREQP